jgi:hypothetical protein
MMRVSEKRAIAGQKGGLGSALARMKLENASRARPLPRRAIALPSSAVAQAGADHSHPHSQEILSYGETRIEAALTPHAGNAEKPAIAVSAELAAYVARRTS